MIQDYKTDTMLLDTHRQNFYFVQKRTYAFIQTDIYLLGRLDIACCCTKMPQSANEKLNYYGQPPSGRQWDETIVHSFEALGAVSTNPIVREPICYLR